VLALKVDRRDDLAKLTREEWLDLHWHVKPRYDHQVEVAGELFEDPNFGHQSLCLEDCHRVVDDAMQEQIIVKIREHLPSALGTYE
jgi:hypothetical protein